MVKPALAGKSQACAPVELSGVVGDSAYRERSRGTWEIRRAGVLTKKAQLGIHNQLVLHGRKSEGIVVAGKRGNSRGAKGPCPWDAESETRRDRLRHDATATGGSFAIRCTERTEMPICAAISFVGRPDCTRACTACLSIIRIILPRLPAVGSSPARNGDKMGSVILDRARG